ncbi:pantetheine-phosphate adenylyltransferase [Tumebacillus sp. ITR2]|uniref:Phosphopantetheine adenylyltransferase n=1 Tax=Tumebacillus amylolyticus TaxID=2801339 RepID=A0ABS1JF54_9BACL|nr:pantetheine-phosphate adenylyltransferase [Tumebacillus amylolyticus]MBL0388845.1 pantetheine-phosphate adenylyltransferase [Tumebacillus amylolyticus]
MRIAIYPGSFDPLTLGHLDIVERSSKIFDKLIVAVMVNPHKNPLFTEDERKELIREAVKHLPNVEVDSSPLLLVNYAQRMGASAIIKGLRFVSDFETELQMAALNRQMYETAETLFMPTSQKHSFLSSSIVKEIARHGGPVTELVPAHVEKAMRAKFE